MGRIDEALKRAASRTSSDSEAPRRDDGWQDTPFVSPWHADKQPPTPTGTVHRLTRADPAERQPAGSLRSDAAGSSSPGLRLESQLAMSWPQPFASEVSEKLVVLRDTDPAAIDQYRQLAEAVTRARSAGDAKVVMVTSAAAGEGKTLTAVNLALTLSQVHGQRVLLLDADLARPRIHELFQVSAGTGLKGYLGGSAQKIPFVDVAATLVLLPAGAADRDADGLASERMRELLADAARSFDWVIVDTTPIVPQASATLPVDFVDRVLLVVDAGHTPRTLVEQAVEIVGRDRLLGVVLNRAD
jgi:capsular exopolysaccharide synthesis family protein